MAEIQKTVFIVSASCKDSVYRVDLPAEVLAAGASAVEFDLLRLEGIEPVGMAIREKG